MIETLDPIDPRTLDRPKGRYTVELFDAASGVLVETRRVDNYISPIYEQAMASHQHMVEWLAVGIANASSVIFPSANTTVASNFMKSLEASRVWNPAGTIPIPMDALIITDDDTAEDTDDAWLRGNVIAHASRWKATVPASGKRGQINEAECAISNVGQTHKTVWDFTTQQGNGTFQTLGIGSLPNHESTLPVQWTALGPKLIAFGGSILPAYTAQPYPLASNIVDDGTNIYYIANEDDTQTGDVCLYSLPSASVWGAADHATEPFAQDASGLTPTKICDTGINFASTPSSNTSTTSPTYFGVMGLAKVGSDFVICYTGHNSGASTAAGGRTVTIRRFTAAGSLVWSTTPCPTGDANANGVNVGMIYDGTDLYVSYGAGNAGAAMYRINATTGALSATVDLPGNLTTYQAVAQFGMAFDGTDILIGTATGIAKVSTAGVAVSPYNYGYPGAGPGSSTAVAPWSSTANLFGAFGRGVAGLASLGLFRMGSYVSVPSSQVFASVYGEANTPNPSSFGFFGTSGMIVKDGKLWVICRNMIADAFDTALGSVALVAVTGANFLSRAVLDSPVTKNTSQNMKITYELTWPGHDPATWPAHQDL